MVQTACWNAPRKIGKLHAGQRWFWYASRWRLSSVALRGRADERIAQVRNAPRMRDRREDGDVLEKVAREVVPHHK